MTDAKNLSNRSAILAASIVVELWIENRGIEAWLCWQDAEKARERTGIEFPEWSIEPLKHEQEAGNFCKRMLEFLLKSKDSEVVDWTQEAIKKVSRPKAQVLDPVTASVVIAGISGFTIVLSIIAARLLRIQKTEKGLTVEFYKGIPDGLDKVIKAGASTQIPQIQEKL